MAVNLRSFRWTPLFVCAFFVAACGDDPVEPLPQTSMSSVSGSGQSATAGQALTNPIVVQVTQGGAALSGATVSWNVTAGGGSVNPTSSTTDGSGQAQTMWTLGPNAGANTVEASVAGATGSPVVFSATGDGPPPTAAAVAVNNNFFDPTSTTIAAGGTVTWTWAGGVPHNVTFSSGSNSVTQTGGTFQRTFPSAGTFDYTCTIHQGMDGTVVVQ